MAGDNLAAYATFKATEVEEFFFHYKAWKKKIALLNESHR